MKQKRTIHRLVAALVFAAAAPSVLMAQSSASLTSTVTAPATAGPSAFGPLATQAGITRALVATEPTLNFQQGHVGGRNVALMLIGGATLVVGSVVGGDAGTIIMITGGVIGLTGLWRYLQ